LEVALMGDPVFFQLTFRRIYSILVVMIWQTKDGEQARPPVWAGPFPWLPGYLAAGCRATPIFILLVAIRLKILPASSPGLE